VLNNIDDIEQHKKTETTILDSTTTSESDNNWVDTRTYSALESIFNYSIDMLKSKEMVFAYDNDDSYSNVNGGTTVTSTYVESQTMTLTQK